MSKLKPAAAAFVAVCFAFTGAFALVGPAGDGGAFAPYTLMVLKRSTRGAGFCSGVVVARDVVLTAAHCVGSADDTRLHFRDGGGAPAILPVAAVATHPGYRANAARTRERSIDLALLRAGAPLDGFRAAPLDAGAAITSGARFRVAGFGVAREGDGRSGGVLRSGVLAARAPLSSILLWAEDPRGAGLGACEGDSGGPVFAEGGDTLVAITAWAAGQKGKGCGGLTQAALVAPHRGWIEGVLRSWGAR